MNSAGEYLHTCRPEPEETKDKINRKKCYLEILGAIFRTEKAAVCPSGLSCIPAPVSCHLRCRKTIPVPYSSGFFNPPHQYTKQPYKAELLQKICICKKKVVDDTENYVIILEYMCVYIITQSVVVTTEGTEGRLGI